MRRRTRLALSAACGLLSVVCAVGYADAACAEVEAERAQAWERYGGEVTTLVVATRQLACDSVVTEGDVELREWLSDLVPDGAQTSLDACVGKRLAGPVACGAPVTQVNLESQKTVLEVPDGRVAVTVRLSEKTGVEADVAAGSRLIAYEVAEERTRLVSSTVTVLGGGAAGSYAASSSLTVAVEPRVVAEVLEAAAQGTLRLVIPAADVEAGTVEDVPGGEPSAEGGQMEAASPEGEGSGGADAPGALPGSVTEAGVAAEEPARGGETL